MATPDDIIDINLSGRAAVVPSLLVRNVDESIVQALKERAARHGRSTEAEHRALLAESLLKPRRRTLAAVLAAIPPVGKEEDFTRVEEHEATRVLD